MTYPPVTIETSADELNRLHGEIERKLQTTVQDAIRAGEILTQVKDRLSHGEFLPWIGAHCTFSEDTAERYRKFYDHADKIRTVRNLQDAYRKVSQIESREKQTESRRARQRVKEYLTTGNKPDGWRRGTDDKIAEQERDRDRRIEAAKAKMEAARIKQEQEREQQKEFLETGRITLDMLEDAANQAITKEKVKREFKQRIRLSQSGESDLFIDALMEYLDELENDNRRIEACQNIIKVCRNIASQLQRSTT